MIQGRMAYKFTNHRCLVGRAACFLAVQYSFGVCLGSECMYMQQNTDAAPGLACCCIAGLLAATARSQSHQLRQARAQQCSEQLHSGPVLAQLASCAHPYLTPALLPCMFLPTKNSSLVRGETYSLDMLRQILHSIYFNRVVQEQKYCVWECSDPASEITDEVQLGSRAASVLACYALVSGTGMFVLYYTYKLQYCTILRSKLAHYLYYTY